MGLSDKIYAIVAAALLLLALGFLAEQEISLRHELSVVNKSLDNEIQCRVGSTCAQKLAAEATRGADLVAQAQATAAASYAAQKAALDKQAADAVQARNAAAALAAKNDAAWQKKYSDAINTANCAIWAKQATACSVE